ncbi:MAG: polysaccharide deacetylase family protein [Candidatus Rokuibacteriota bacterium]
MLATLDVHDHPRLEAVVEKSAEFFARSNERVTYFIPSAIVLRHTGIRHILREIRRVGHSVGCHGLTHDASEDLGSLSPRAEYLVLRQATEILEDTLGAPVRSFRAPGFRISRRTQEILTELGYKADLSVTPQRLCVLSSSPVEVGWMWAPRTPYAPRAGNPFRRGELDLLEIPTSTLGLPLTHGTIANVPDWLTQALLAGLSLEAMYFPRVLVPMFHPEAIVGEVEPWRPQFRWRDLFPSRVGGVRARFYFFLERDARTIHRRTMATIRQLRDVAGLESLSVDDYLRRYVTEDGTVSSEFA